MNPIISTTATVTSMQTLYFTAATIWKIYMKHRMMYPIDHAPAYADTAMASDFSWSVPPSYACPIAMPAKALPVMALAAKMIFKMSARMPKTITARRISQQKKQHFPPCFFPTTSLGSATGTETLSSSDMVENYGFDIVDKGVEASFVFLRYEYYENNCVEIEKEKGTIFVSKAKRKKSTDF